MKIYKMNNRKCIITHKIMNKKDLIRIVKLKDGTYEVDSNAQGRGAYVSRKKENIEIIIRKRLLHRTFRENVDKETYNKLSKILEEA